MINPMFIANMLRIAAEDLAGAKLLASASNRNAVYLCEQAAEKIIRAVLTSEEIDAGPSHLLEAMVDRIPDANPIKRALRKIEHLAAYATAYRYPTSPSGRIKGTPMNFDAVAADVQAALDEAAKGFDVDLAKQNTPARRVAKLR